MTSFLRMVKNCGREVVVVKYHNEAVNHVRKFPKVSRLINLDYHSDITDMSTEACNRRNFNEGTWINYVVGMKKKEFVWRYPFENNVDLAQGYCHDLASPFLMEPKAQRDIGWKSISMAQGLPSIDDLNRCQAFSICVSPNWPPRNHNIDPVDVLINEGFLSRTEARKYRKSNCNTSIEKIDSKIFNELHS